MSAIDRLDAYLAALHRRLALQALGRGLAVTAAAALGGTVALAIVMNGFAFSPPTVTGSRIALALSIGAAVALAIIVPVLRLTRKLAALSAERKAPQLDQRLLTAAELRRNGGDAFLELLAGDALERAPEPAAVAPAARIAGLASGAALGCMCLIWLVTAKPGFIGYGASLLWGAEAAEPLYAITVTPGDHAVRRNADQTITARLEGFRSSRASVFARYRGSSRWEQAEMRQSGGGFEFVFPGIPDSLDYYVESRGVRSRTFTLSVKDLPTVQSIRVTYRYPDWTGLRPSVEDPGGDLRAVEGTEAEIAVTTDRPLSSGVVVMDGAEPVRLEGGRATIPINKDGSYYIASEEDGELVRLTDDYFIEAKSDELPVVKIERPARDARVSPIEEVTVEVSAADDFGLRGVTVNYSVNGGPERAIEVGGGNRTRVNGRTTLFLEDFHMAPGDIVSLYATARDARNAARTDMYFLQAEPFERRVTQSQSSGEQNAPDAGGGGISERQKEIIAATWNALRDKADAAHAAEDARFLSGVQAKLRDQAQSLAVRMQRRQLSEQSDEMKAFAREMSQAAEAMTPASEQLARGRWRDAMAPEQKALQHLLRAESIFRDIQVAYGRTGQRGGGMNAGRDLESLFDLELDTEKNQYELGSRASQEQRDKSLDEMFEKLRELARRQQELARNRSQRKTVEQRWQQEMLRREAEELRRRMEEMARAGQGGGAARQAASEMQRAVEEMRRAASQGQAGRQSQRDGQQTEAEQMQAWANAQRASERLRDAERALEQAQRQEAASRVSDVARRAGQLSAQQQEYTRRLEREFGRGEPVIKRSPGAEQLAKDRDRMLAELQKLEHDVQDSARALAETGRDAAARMREALSKLQSDEVRTRIRFNAELLRRGYGAYTLMREQPVTQALRELADNLDEARKSIERRRPEDGDSPEDAERALRAVERLRREMEQADRSGRLPQSGSYATGLMRVGQALQNYPELERKIRSAPEGELLERLAQVELELRRRLGEAVPAEARAQPDEPVAPGYADAVAEYFRRLSQEK